MLEEAGVRLEREAVEHQDRNGHAVIEENGASAVGNEEITPEILFKISKKIAQLTKVIYSLNTR